ncbi:MAG: hypothetical protein SGJ20_01020 [Planctomycetota bacterium]|nr:hypothetical protein [Planctomycetota bacterium]
MALLAAFMVVVYFAAPAALPLFFQRMVGLVNAMLAMIAAMFAVREYARGYNRVRVPGLTRLHTASWVGSAVLIAVMVWWCSSYAPIQVASL